MPVLSEMQEQCISAPRALECIALGRGATGHSETGDVGTEDAETSERD